MRAHTRRPVLAGIATAVMASLALVGCSTGSASTDDAVNTALTVGLLATPSNLDYTTTAGAAIPQALLYNVYEGLVKLDNDGTIHPLLAQSWTVSGDGLVYDFVLQEGVTFSDGSPFTADSVKFSLERVKANWTANGPAYLDSIASIEAVSDTQARITLSKPSNSWLFNMTGPVGTMFTESGVANLATDAIGTGPYTVASFQTGDSLVLAANTEYWGEAPYLTDVRLRYFTDTTAQTNALLSGDINLISGISQFQLVDQFKSNADFQVLEGTSTGEVTLSMNNASEAFSDVRVRQAVMYAIDRSAVMDTVSSGYGLLIGSMVAPTDPWYDASLADLYPYDPDKATELLDAAGVRDLSVAFKIPNLPYAVAGAQVVKDQLAQVGITANVTTLEFPALWLDEVFAQHDYDMSLIMHSEPRDVTAFAARSYYAGYDSPEVMAQFAQADAADPATYIDLMKQATTTMAEEAAADWLYLQPAISIGEADLLGVPKNTPSLALDLSNISR
ncbi:ABC transporter substrate-binding protein [Cryobacterium sp. Y11]|uniref:ABC transporter substrate-binding protein n=1 Tax=Cryobacterium sp. Y11 TaxID=2045016 RepID=UPI0018ED996C|nr:ABC transporter substrate-binding protein [Cryobacterium sp. Y11]